MTTTPPQDRLERVEAILEVLARETLANTRAIADLAGAQAAGTQATAEVRALQADNARAIAQLAEGTEQLKRAVDYLMSRDG